MKIFEKLSLKHISLFFIIFSMFIILSGVFSWRHGEILWFICNTFDNGFNIQFSDLPKAFDFLAYDGTPRTRFLSNFFKVFDTKLLIWAYEHHYYNLSISFNWILSLIISPILLYKLMKKLVNSETAWITTALFTCSVGFLSSNVMYFHVAKSLVISFAIIMMYLLSLLKERQDYSTNLNKKDFFLFFILGIVYFFSLNSDESGILFIGLSWIFFPNFIFKTTRGRLIILTAFLTFAIYLFWALTIVPVITDYFNYGDFNFLENMDKYGHVRRCKLFNVIQAYLFNLIFFFNINIDPFYDTALYHFDFLKDLTNFREFFVKYVNDQLLINPKLINKCVASIYYFCLPIFFFYLIRRINRNMNKKTLSILKYSLICFIFLVLGETILFPAPRIMNYYYGSLICIPTSIMFACLLDNNNYDTTFIRNLKKILLIFLCLVSLNAFCLQNKAYALSENGWIFGRYIVYKFINKKNIFEKKAYIVYNYAQDKQINDSDICFVYSEDELYYRKLLISRIDNTIKVKRNCVLKSYIDDNSINKVLFYDKDITDTLIQNYGLDKN